MLSKHRDDGSMTPTLASCGGVTVSRDIGKEGSEDGGGDAHGGQRVRVADVHRVTITAAMNGPMNSPIRKVPPRVDRARARKGTGMASVR